MSHGSDDALHEEHEEHVNHEAWVIPYADLLTLLMAMFIALFAMSTVDMTKFKALAVGFNEALGGGKLDASIGGSGKVTSPVIGQGNGTGALDGSTLTPSDSTSSAEKLSQVLAQLAGLQAQKVQERQSLQQVANQIEARAKAGGYAGKLQLRLENDGLVVTVVTDKVLFDSGSAQLQPSGGPLLTTIADALKAVDNPLIIAGYTDNVPIASAIFPSNGELSSARAWAVERFLESQGIGGARMDVRGRGARDPVASNATADGRARNRRVEIIVQSKLVDQVVKDAGLDHNTPTTTAPIEAPVSSSISGANPGITPSLGAR